MRSAGTLRPEHWLLLAVLGVAGFFEGYDSYVFSVALPQIRESFGLSQGQASLWLSVLFLGSLPAVFIARRADVHGRRRLLIASILGYSLFTGLTALAPSIGFFVTAQFVARLFLNAEVVLAWTMVAEELPASSRGFGFGWLAMLSAGGAAAGSLVFGALFVPIGVSWRWLYFVALPPLAVAVCFRRFLPETSRYASARESGELHSHWHAILREPHRKWFVLVGGTDLLFALATIADVFAIDFMQTNRGLSATQANLIIVAAGVLAIPVIVWAGSLSDRYGRKQVGCFFGALSFVGIFGFFYASRGPIDLFFFLLVTLIGQFGAWPTLDAYTSELFPTGLRAFAASFSSLWRVVGESLSLVIGSALIAGTGSLGPTAVILSGGPLLAVVIIWRRFPDTNGLELEAIGHPPAEPIEFGPRQSVRVLSRRRVG